MHADFAVFFFYLLVALALCHSTSKQKTFTTSQNRWRGRRNYLPWLFPLAGGENKVYRVGELEREEKEARSSKREREGERKEERRESAAIDTAKKKKMRRIQMTFLFWIAPSQRLNRKFACAIVAFCCFSAKWSFWGLVCLWASWSQYRNTLDISKYHAMRYLDIVSSLKPRSTHTIYSFTVVFVVCFYFSLAYLMVVAWASTSRQQSQFMNHTRERN